MNLLEIEAPTPVDVQAPWREEVLFLPSRDDPPVRLVTTLYLPATGAGPFPLLVFNHGKPYAGPASVRCEPTALARAMTQAGIAVAAPNRKGFADSGGRHVSHWRNPLSAALCCAQDIAAAVDGLSRHPEIDANHIVVAGHSYGALGTLAYGRQASAGVTAMVNFMGGLRAEHEAGWQQPLLEAFRYFGKRTRKPALWFYARNDSFWHIDDARQFHAAYVASGAEAEFIDLGTFKEEAHYLVLDEEGVALCAQRLLPLFEQHGIESDHRTA
ncbi:alpha/beta hydrolase family protein [Chitinolyticbacter meiyuanensis]|uniref:alpha/beta hydrolase family protein n=1 Tax=Chitinolyticbacter meiyuanensis TaxID=682798 RepID=UPI0011E5DB47|nr:alpha/beta hydrolase [Chitinolyticbacter meiyuanensis]